MRTIVHIPSKETEAQITSPLELSMKSATHSLTFSGKLLQRGFWLYVWEINAPGNKRLYYVGRTGDSSSSNAQSPFNRMSHHLGFNAKSNVLRRRLLSNRIDPERCAFRLIAHGPILKEAATQQAHRGPRDTTAALEKALAVALLDAGYNVINSVNCRMPLDNKLFADVISAFGTQFPRLTAKGKP
jgi:hypothetical protein